jgi:hypothetical protein
MDLRNVIENAEYFSAYAFLHWLCTDAKPTGTFLPASAVADLRQNTLTPK